MDPLLHHQMPLSSSATTPTQPTTTQTVHVVLSPSSGSSWPPSSLHFLPGHVTMPPAIDRLPANLWPGQYTVRPTSRPPRLHLYIFSNMDRTEHSEQTQNRGLPAQSGPKMARYQHLSRTDFYAFNRLPPTPTNAVLCLFA